MKIVDILLENGYRGSHRAPYNDGYNKPMHDLTDFFGDDIYGDLDKAVRYYWSWKKPEDKTVIGLMQSAKDNPDMEVEIYRAIPADVEEDDINPRDWVAIHPAYAKEHGERHINGDYKIIDKVVPAKHLYTDGNSVQEWGYDPN